MLLLPSPLQRRSRGETETAGEGGEVWSVTQRVNRIHELVCLKMGCHPGDALPRLGHAIPIRHRALGPARGQRTHREGGARDAGHDRLQVIGVESVPPHELLEGRSRGVGEAAGGKGLEASALDLEAVPRGIQDRGGIELAQVDAVESEPPLERLVGSPEAASGKLSGGSLPRESLRRSSPGGR